MLEMLLLQKIWPFLVLVDGEKLLSSVKVSTLFVKSSSYRELMICNVCKHLLAILFDALS